MRKRFYDRHFHRNVNSFGGLIFFNLLFLKTQSFFFFSFFEKTFKDTIIQLF